MATKSDAQIRRTNKYKAILAITSDPDEAVKTYRRVVLGEEPETPEQTLEQAGFTGEQAEHILAEGAAVEPQAIQTGIEKLIEERGFDFAKGRVYVTPDTIEAAVRVRKTGHPEIVTSTRGTRQRAVALFKTEEGDVALQNLILKG